MIVDLKDYVMTAILFDIADKDFSGFVRVFDAEKFQDEIERIYNVLIPAPLVSSSIYELVKRGGGEILSDPFTRDYTYLSKEKCLELFEDLSENSSTPFGKASLVGRQYVEEALLQIRNLSDENLLAEFYDFQYPDDFVEIDHSSPAAAEIDAEFERLSEELVSNNAVGIELADSKDIAILEVKALRARWDESKIRIVSFINQAQQSLMWIVKQGGTTVVTETAKRLFNLIWDFFSK